jgi:UDP-N-acetylmuramoylalanine--D-glutamate ligase
MKIQGKTIVIGGGKSGISSAKLLLRQGLPFAIYDGNPDYQLPDELKGTDCFLGEMTEEEMDSFDTVVVSPGVPLEMPLVDAFIKKGKYVIGEIELAYQFAKGKIIGITGTNGKTTTTTLVGEIMKSHYDEVFVVGNIGIPFTDIADQTSENSVTVIELSSFQLETVDSFHADVSAILNLTPDHLNRHLTMERYAECKFKITNGQNKEEVCVLNAENEYTREFSKSCPATTVMFSSERKLKNGLYLKDKEIVLVRAGYEMPLMNVHDMNLVGKCNAENVMAAIAMGIQMHVPLAKIITTIKNFKAVEHRIEYVTTKRGIRFYNDSKGTNPDAAIQGIRAMDCKTCLIGGGYDKEIPFDDWIKAFDGKVKKLVLIGQTAKIIAETAEKYGFSDYVFADSLEEAIDICYETAEEGEAVLLSPACASWGMFPNYEVRGDIFKEYVRNLEE